MNANAELSTSQTTERDRRHQLLLIETMAREGASECQIVAAVAGKRRHERGPLRRLRRGLGAALAA